jgi:hypothetical protein
MCIMPPPLSDYRFSDLVQKHVIIRAKWQSVSINPIAMIQLLPARWADRVATEPNIENEILMESLCSHGAPSNVDNEFQPVICWVPCVQSIVFLYMSCLVPPFTATLDPVSLARRRHRRCNVHAHI